MNDSSYYFLLYMIYYLSHWVSVDRLCGLVTRVPGYRFSGPLFNCWRDQIFWEIEGLERGPLILVRIREELLQTEIYFKLQIGFYPVVYHYDNTTHKYACHIHNTHIMYTHIMYTHIHILHKITPLETNNGNKEKQKWCLLGCYAVWLL
jgi:hypothetical protein